MPGASDDWCAQNFLQATSWLSAAFSFARELSSSFLLFAFRGPEKVLYLTTVTTVQKLFETFGYCVIITTRKEMGSSLKDQKSWPRPKSWTAIHMSS